MNGHMDVLYHVCISSTDYQPYLQGDNQNIEKVHSLSHAEYSGKHQITGLAWNRTGGVLAARYAWL